MEPGLSPAATPARKIVRLWQSYNQRRWEFEKDVLGTDERAPFVCECTSADCLLPVELTMGEYEAAHMCPNWCAVLPGHLLPTTAVGSPFASRTTGSSNWHPLLAAPPNQ